MVFQVAGFLKEIASTRHAVLTVNQLKKDLEGGNLQH